MSKGQPPKLLVDVTGVIEAPINKVWPLFRRAVPSTEESGVTAAHQGGWWYRGEWSAHPHGNNTLVTHRVYNVAQGMRWGVPLANRFFIGFTEKTRNGFQRAITDVSQQLDTNGYLIPARSGTTHDAAPPPAEPD
jgi:hypothetical protein